MSGRVFLDTNIVLDFLDQERQLNSFAHNLIDFLTQNNSRIFISEDMLSTIYYIEKSDPRVLTFFTSILKKWNIVPFGLNVIRKAIDFSLVKRVDFKDALQLFCAIENDCAIFITNDKSFPNCGMKVLSAKGFLDKYKKQ